VGSAQRLISDSSRAQEGDAIRLVHFQSIVLPKK